MATLRSKGTRDDRRVYVRYQVGSGPSRQQYERILPGIRKASDPDAKATLAKVEKDLAEGRDPFPPPQVPKRAKELLTQWRDSLTNRSARDDRSRLDLHLIPYWGDHQLQDIDLPKVMNWIDALKKGPLSVQTQRHCLNLLSRWYSWLIERGIATTNPVKMVPSRLRPVPSLSSDRPWLEDDSMVPKIMEALGHDLGLMFYLCNRSGMRLGEVCGLRMGDMEFLHEGNIRVGHSYDGPLKEDRRGVGKVKRVPAPEDGIDRLKLHLARRRLHGADAEDLVFVAPVREKGRRRLTTWLGYKREYIDDQWREVREQLGIEHLTWYSASRHSMVSRNLKAGASLDEVSAAVGHSAPSVTRKHYDHYVRKTFSSTLTRGLG